MTHGVLSGSAAQRVEDLVIGELVITDSIKMTDAVRSVRKIRQISLNNLIGRAIRAVADESSVSSLFD